MSFLPTWQLPFGGATAGLTATGTTQGTALALTQQNNEITTVASGTGVILPATSNAGRTTLVVNGGVNDLFVYPPIGATIDNNAANVGVVVRAGNRSTFIAISTTKYYSFTNSIGAQVVNYMAPVSFGDTVSGFTAYNDGAAAPIDGTGGTPAGLTLGTNTVASLRGSSQLQLSKDAANRLGNGFAYTVNLEPADYTRLMTFSVEMRLTSGTLAADDLRFYAIRVSDLTVIPLSPLRTNTLTVGSSIRFGGDFLSLSSAGVSDQYRICVHVASTSALAWVLSMDSFSLAPKSPNAPVIITLASTVDQALPDNVPTIVAFNSIVAAPFGIATTGGSARYTFPCAGTFQAIATFQMSGTPLGNGRTANIRKNGSVLQPDAQLVNTYNASTAYVTLHPQASGTCVAGDYIDATATCSGSAAISLNQCSLNILFIPSVN